MRIGRPLAAGLAAVALLVPALPATAQDERPVTTISSIERSEAEGDVYLEGSGLAQADDEAYLFSDGTGVITLDIDPSAAIAPLPLFELIGVEGTVASDRIVVSGWELLPIMTPAVVVPEEDVIEAYWAWIIAFGSQAPA